MTFVEMGIHFSQGQCMQFEQREKKIQFTWISNRKDKCCLNTDVFFFILKNNKH